MRYQRNQFGSSIIEIEPQNKEAYEFLKANVNAEEWAWRKVGNLPWRYRVAIDHRYLDNIVEGFEADGWIFKKKVGQTPGRAPDFIAFNPE